MAILFVNSTRSCCRWLWRPVAGLSSDHTARWMQVLFYLFQMLDVAKGFDFSAEVEVSPIEFGIDPRVGSQYRFSRKRPSIECSFNFNLFACGVVLAIIWIVALNRGC